MRTILCSKVFTHSFITINRFKEEYLYQKSCYKKCTLISAYEKEKPVGNFR